MATDHGEIEMGGNRSDRFYPEDVMEEHAWKEKTGIENQWC